MLEAGADFREHDLYAHLLLKEILNEIDRSLLEKDSKRIAQCVTYLETFGLRPGRENLILLLDRLAAGETWERSQFDRIVQLVRSSPF